MSQFTQAHPSQRNQDFAMPVGICHVPKEDVQRREMIEQFCRDNANNPDKYKRAGLSESDKLRQARVITANYKSHKQFKAVKREFGKSLKSVHFLALGKWRGAYRQARRSAQVADLIRDSRMSYAEVFDFAEAHGLPLQAIEIIGDGGQVLETWERDLAPGNLFVNAQDLRLGFCRVIPAAREK